MKKFKLLLTLSLKILFFVSCSDDDIPMIIADLYSDDIAFQNNFASEYLISQQTSTNIADRFIWNEVTTVTTNQYTLEGSSNLEFSNPRLIGITNRNNHVVLVQDLLALATELNLDDDPETTDANGNPNNAGTVFFRVKASIGNGGAGSDEIYSEIASINIQIIERTVNNEEECDILYILGDATADIGWNFPGKEVVCEAGVLQVKVYLVEGFLNFFTSPGDWGSAQNYASFESQGYSIDSNFENSPAGDSFRFIGIPGIYTIVINTENKTIVLQESSSLWAVGGAVPGGWGFNDDTVELVESTPDIWSASITLNNDIFRFFQTFGTWDVNNNYTYYENLGFTIDPNFESQPGGDANFNFIGTPGTYQLTINSVNKTITLN